MNRNYLPHPGLAFIVIIAASVCWLPIINILAKQWTADSIYRVSAIYGTSRGINALVSVLQGTTIDFPLVNIALGEILDPINDLIERFSGVITVALGSLILQKILFEIVATTAFNWVVTGLALLTIVASAIKRKRITDTLLKTFLIAVFIRLSLCIVFLLGFSVDNFLLKDNEVKNHDQMQAYQQNLRGLNVLVSSRPALHKESDRLMDLLGKLGKEKNGLKDKVGQIDLDIMLTQATIDVLGKERGIFGSKSFEEIEAELRLKKLQKAKSSTQRAIEQVDGQIKAVYQQMDIAGLKENPGTFTSGDITKLLAWKEIVNSQIEYMQEGVSDLVDSVMTLLVAIVLKSIILPVFFCYMLLWGAKSIWKYEHKIRPVN